MRAPCPICGAPNCTCGRRSGEEPSVVVRDAPKPGTKLVLVPVPGRPGLSVQVPAPPAAAKAEEAEAKARRPVRNKMRRPEQDKAGGE